MRFGEGDVGEVGFNTQPPEGGWGQNAGYGTTNQTVSTHSRLKAAGVTAPNLPCGLSRFNTQPPEGGWGFRMG